MPHWQQAPANQTDAGMQCEQAASKEKEKPSIDISSYPRHYANKPAARSETNQAAAPQPVSSTGQAGYGAIPKDGPSHDEYRQWMSGYNSRPGQAASSQQPSPQSQVLTSSSSAPKMASQVHTQTGLVAVYINFKRTALAHAFRVGRSHMS